MSLRDLIFGHRPAFNYFLTVKAVLKRNLAAIAEQQDLTDGQLRAQMIAHLEHISGQYFTGRKPQIPYCDPICRAAYLYSYVAVNAICVNSPSGAQMIWWS